MRGTSNNYVISIYSSLLPVFQYHTSNLLAGSRPTVGRKGCPHRKRGASQGSRLAHLSFKAAPEKELKCEGRSGDEPTCP